MRAWLFSMLLSISLPHIHASTVHGDVKSQEDGKQISGATVEVIERHLFTITDQKGNFSFKDLREGTYHIKVTAVGFMPDSLSFTVKNGKEQALSIRLKTHTTTLNSVIVTHNIDAGSSVYDQMLQRRSMPLVDIISREAIEQAGDITMADVIQRASSVSMSANHTGVLTKAIIRGMDTKYSYTAVNGIAIPSPDDKSRYLSLNLFPANLIERLEVYKTLTPEQPGNAIGGMMNIVTPEPSKKTKFSAQLATGYSQLFLKRSFLAFDNKAVQFQSPYEKYNADYYAKGGDFSKGNLSFSHIRPLPDLLANIYWSKMLLHQKLGVVVNLSLQNMKEGSNSFLIVQNHEPQLSNTPGVTDFIKRQYSNISNRKSIYAKTEYHLNHRNHLLLDQLYTLKKDIEARDWIDTSLAEGRSGPGTGRIAFSQRSQIHYQSLYHVRLQGNHQINNALHLNWASAYSNAYGAYPDWAEYSANTGRILEPDGNIKATPILLAPMTRTWMHNSEKEKDLSLNMDYTPEKFHQHVKIKAGALLQYKKRNNFYNQYIFNPAYTQSGGQPFTDIYHAIWYDNNGPQNPQGNVNTPGTYTGKENISALYGELDFHLKKIALLTGIRTEHTHQLIISSAAPTDNLGKQVSINYTDWLPSLHLRYALNKSQDIRLSYYKALSRPALYDITFFNINYDDYNIAGTPFLKHSTANNIDLRYELYVPKILNELQVTAFYKQIKNPYEKTLLTANDTLYPVPDGGQGYISATKITEQLRNFGTAYNYGLDVSLVKKIGNLTVSGNYTFTSSKIKQSKKYKQREDPADPTSDITTITLLQNRPLQGQSENIANINLSYQIPQWDYTALLTGTYTGKRIEDVSGWYNMDNWQKAYVILNCSLEKKAGPHWRFFARISNILNGTRVIYIKGAESAAIPEQTEKDKLIIEKVNTYPQYILGIQWHL